MMATSESSKVYHLPAERNDRTLCGLYALGMVNLRDNKNKRICENCAIALDRARVAKRTVKV